MNESRPMILKRVDGHWEVEILRGRSVPGFDDSVMIRITEKCPPLSKLIQGNQITLGLTAADVRELAIRLVAVAADDEATPREESGAAGESAVEPARKPRRDHDSFTAKQGQYLAFIHRYISRFGRAPAELDIQRHFLVSAPTVNQMMQRLERLGLIARTPGQARSIRLLISPELLQHS